MGVVAWYDVGTGLQCYLDSSFFGALHLAKCSCWYVMYTMYISSVSNCKYDAKEDFFRLCLCDLVLAATKQRR